MKKLFLTITAIIIFSNSVYAQQDYIALPSIDKTGGMPLMQALSERKTIRSFSKEPIQEDVLAEILWAGAGKNREENKLTIPTALNRQNVFIYVLSDKGSFLYDAQNHSLIKITDADLRPVKDAPITLAYAADKNKGDKLYAAMHVGSAYQNVGLYAASKHMANVVRGSFDRGSIERGLKLPKNIEVLITQAIGYPIQ